MELSSKRLAIDFIISGIGKVLLRKIKEGGRIRNDGQSWQQCYTMEWKEVREGSCVDMYRLREQPVQDGSGE